MNEKDLRDCFAMFKIITGASPEECYRFADEMLEAREAKATVGLPPVRARKTKEK